MARPQDYPRSEYRNISLKSWDRMELKGGKKIVAAQTRTESEHGNLLSNPAKENSKEELVQIQEESRQQQSSSSSNVKSPEMDEIGERLRREHQEAYDYFANHFEGMLREEREQRENQLGEILSTVRRELSVGRRRVVVDDDVDFPVSNMSAMSDMPTSRKGRNSAKIENFHFGQRTSPLRDQAENFIGAGAGPPRSSLRGKQASNGHIAARGPYPDGDPYHDDSSGEDSDNFNSDSDESTSSIDSDIDVERAKRRKRKEAKLRAKQQRASALRLDGYGREVDRARVKPASTLAQVHDRIQYYQPRPDTTHIHLNTIEIKSVIKFRDQCDEYFRRNSIVPNPLNLISESVRTLLMSRFSRQGLGTYTAFMNQDIRYFWKRLFKEAVPTSEYEFRNVLKELRFYWDTSHEHKGQETIERFQESMLHFIVKYSKYVYWMSWHNSACTPACDDKEGGLIRIFKEKLPHEYGRNLVRDTIGSGRGRKFQRWEDFRDALNENLTASMARLRNLSSELARAGEVTPKRYLRSRDHEDKSKTQSNKFRSGYPSKDYKPKPSTAKFNSMKDQHEDHEDSSERYEKHDPSDDPSQSDTGTGVSDTRMLVHSPSDSDNLDDNADDNDRLNYVNERSHGMTNFKKGQSDIVRKAGSSYTAPVAKKKPGDYACFNAAVFGSCQKQKEGTCQKNHSRQALEEYASILFRALWSNNVVPYDLKKSETAKGPTPPTQKYTVLTRSNTSSTSFETPANPVSSVNLLSGELLNFMMDINGNTKLPLMYVNVAVCNGTDEAIQVAALFDSGANTKNYMSESFLLKNRSYFRGRISDVNTHVTVGDARQIKIKEQVRAWVSISRGDDTIEHELDFDVLDGPNDMVIGLPSMCLHFLEISIDLLHEASRKFIEGANSELGVLKTETEFSDTIDERELIEPWSRKIESGEEDDELPAPFD